jgi:hypothetical protein
MSKVVLRAYKPKKEPICVCRPVQNAGGLTFTGQGKKTEGYYEQLSEEDKRKMAYVITPSTGVRISDGHVLDLDNIKDAANWKWLQKHPYISMSKLANPSTDEVFYVFNAEVDAELKVSKAKRSATIQSKVFAMAEVDQRRLAAAMGYGDVSGLNQDQVLDYLLGKITLNIGMVERLVDDKETTAAKEIFHKAVNRDVLTRTHGWYMFEEDIKVGASEESAIIFLLDDENKDVVLAIQARLAEFE